MLAALTVTFDYVATLTDLVALDPEPAGGEVIVPLLGSVKALNAIAVLLGFDFPADVEDFKSLIDSGK